MNWIIYTILGAFGGLLTTLAWVDKRHYEPVKDKINIPKIVRNLSIGAIVGGYFGILTGYMEVAILTGLAGEFIIQKLGRFIEVRI